MRVKLVEVVKWIPYQKVEINVDPPCELELEEDTPDQAADTTARTAAAPPPPTPRPQAATPPYTGALTRELAAPAWRISEVPNTGTTLKARLEKRATDAMVVGVERRSMRGVSEEDA